MRHKELRTRPSAVLSAPLCDGLRQAPGDGACRRIGAARPLGPARPPACRPMAAGAAGAAAARRPGAVEAGDGTKQQNVVRVRGMGWGPRWGRAACAIDLTENEERQFGQSRMFVLGSDSWTRRRARQPAQRRVQLLRRGVGRSQEFGRRNKNGDPMPVTSMADWSQVARTCCRPGAPTFRPAGVPQRPMRLARRAWRRRGEGRRDDVPAPGQGRGVPTVAPLLGELHRRPAVPAEAAAGVLVRHAAPGSFIGRTRWSPRRNHAAIVLNKVMYVIGGRSTPQGDMPEGETLGGIHSALVDATLSARASPSSTATRTRAKGPRATAARAARCSGRRRCLSTTCGGPWTAA